MAIDKVNSNFAANAYANMQKAVTGASDDAGGTGSADGAGDAGGFGSVLKTMTTKAIDTVHQGEKASAAAVAGKADLADVVQAVNGAEFTLETFVAVRDRMISAYDKVMSMAM